MFDPRQTETKSVGYGGNNFTSFPDYLLANGHEDLSAFATIALYKKAMPLFNAVSMRAEAFAQIPIRLWDKKKDQWINEHKVLDLLRTPNADVSQLEFLESFSSYFDITGESFIVASGRITRPPLELSVIGPQSINFSSTGNKFGMLHVPTEIKVSTAEEGQTTFKAREFNAALGLRYVTQDEQNQIWHTRSFNPLRSSNSFRGLSRAQPLWTELQQYVAGNNTNLSMLKRGTRLSMAWVNTRSVALTDTQWSRMQEEAQKYQGDINAGGTPILDGVDVKSIQQTNKDMQFKDLQDAMLSRISTVYRIPLALLLSQSMTLNNLQTSLLQFYDVGALPHTTRLYGELSRFLLPMYKGSENMEFRFNENDIPALRVRIIEAAKTRSEVNVNTIDEIRTVLGDEALAEGGDQVFRSSALIPIGSDAFTDDQLTEPAANKYRVALYEQGKSKVEVEEIVTKMGKDLNAS